MAVVNGVTLLAKRFAIGGVEDKRKKFLDLPRMVGLFSRIAATFANAMRRFKDGAAGITFAVTCGLPAALNLASGDALAATSKDVVVNPWVTISTDGTIAIMSPAAEMGQGALTSLPLILAE